MSRHTRANTITWPARCESVLLAVYAHYYREGDLTLGTIADDVRETPEWFSDRVNFGHRSMAQMKAILAEHIGADERRGRPA